MSEKKTYTLERHDNYQHQRWTAVCQNDDERVTVAPNMRALIRDLARHLCDRHEQDKRLTITVEASE